MRKILQILKWVFVGLFGSALVGVLLTFVVKDRVPVSLPFGSVRTELWDSGNVKASGTWVISEIEPAFPLQTSEIVCRKTQQQCIESMAALSDSHLLVWQFTRTINQWDDEKIIFSDSTDCVDSLYTLERFGKKLTGTRRTKNTLKSCILVDVIDTRTLYLTLLDGFSISQKYEKQAVVRFGVYALAVLAVVWLLIAGRIWRVFANKQ